MIFQKGSEFQNKGSIILNIINATVEDQDQFICEYTVHNCFDGEIVTDVIKYIPYIIRV